MEHVCSRDMARFLFVWRYGTGGILWTSQAHSQSRNSRRRCQKKEKRMGIPTHEKRERNQALIFFLSRLDFEIHTAAGATDCMPDRAARVE